MDFAKRNPILTTILALCVALFVAESYFLWSFSGSVSTARRELSRSIGRAKDVEKLNPAPTAENRDAAAKNAEELKAVLTKVKSTFQDTPIKITNIPSSSNEIVVDINGFVAAMRDLAASKQVITYSDKPTFGMAMYIGNVPPPPADKIPAVYKQVKILEFILSLLFNDGKQANQEMKLVSVRRENVAEVRKLLAPGVYAPSSTDSGDDEHNELFKIDPAVTARVPGAVDTYAFQIRFISYTESLRKLVEDLKRFDMPLVIRSIEVEPATTADLAGTPDGAAAVASAKKGGAAVSENAKPVVAENLSKFTLVLEYIELPSPVPAAGTEFAPGAATDAGTAGAAGSASPAAATSTGTSN